MKEEKLKRLITAFTVTGVLFVVMLISVIVYQLVNLTLLKNKKDKLESEIQQLETKIEDTKEQIEINSSYWYIEQKAREYGFVYEDDIEFKG